MRTRLALPFAARRAAIRHTDRGLVDPVELLLAIHDADTPQALAAARLAAIDRLGVIGGRVWRGGCPVTAGADAVALGCVVGHVNDDDLNPEASDITQADDQGRVHVAHQPLHFHTRIAWVSASTESRITRAATRKGEPAA